jgi:hypothetical protein
MTDLERFTQAMAEMMGVTTNARPGYFVEQGELTPEVRKWWAENLPEAWEKYVSHFMICYNYAEGEDLNKIADTIFTRMLSVTLSAENLWKWMRENTDSWLYEKCPKCHGTEFSNVEHVGRFICDLCNGTGRVAKWDVEKWLEGKMKEVGA